jgi:hypothetical protein
VPPLHDAHEAVAGLICSVHLDDTLPPYVRTVGNPRSGERFLMRRTVAIVAALAVPTALAAASIGPSVASADPSITWQRLGSYSTGLGADSAEIAALNGDRLYVINGAANSLDIVDVSDPAEPVRKKRISLDDFGGGPHSVAVKGGLVAVAVEADEATDPGRVVFLNPAGKVRGSVEVGSLPDMLTFTPDGRSVVVANEGEPSSYGLDDSVDPVGSVSIIEVGARSLKRPVVRTAGFDGFSREQLVASGVRLNGPGATVAQDLEPEYVTVSSDSQTAWVTLQEANSYATVDLSAAVVTDITPFGEKDHSMPGQGLDASDRDGEINIAAWPIRGLYMPDAIASFEVDDRRYVVTANEGDARDYQGFTDEGRVKDIPIEEVDVDAFGGADAWSALRADAALGRLTVSSTDGINPESGLRESLFAFGARSFSIWDADTGDRVYDSGDFMEQHTAAISPDYFNASNSDNTFDSRSDNKGPEPEGVTVGVVDGRTYAFVGLERIGGFMVFDVTDPAAPGFVEWVNNRDFTDPGFGPDGGPEGLAFVASNLSPTGEPVLVVAHEVTGTVSLYGPAVTE